jgi:transposase
MSQNNHNPSIIYVGLDIAKASLALHLEGRFHNLTNDSKGHEQLLKLLGGKATAFVVCETKVVRALQVAKVPVAVVEPSRVRNYARARGQRAKSDPIDAAVLSAYGAAIKPPPALAPNGRQERLAQFISRRRHLVESSLVERNRAEHYVDPFSQKQSRKMMALLEKQIQECETAIAQIINEDEELKRKANRLIQIPGVGPVVAATVLAELPELGTVAHECASALVGVAPYDNESGTTKGSRHIAGGRKFLRRTLYMAALSATRHDRILKAFYERLRAAGKTPKVALVACIRKLVVLMNRLLKNPDFTLVN